MLKHGRSYTLYESAVSNKRKAESSKTEGEGKKSGLNVVHLLCYVHEKDLSPLHKLFPLPTALYYEYRQKIAFNEREKGRKPICTYHILTLIVKSRCEIYFQIYFACI